MRTIPNPNPHPLNTEGLPLRQLPNLGRDWEPCVPESTLDDAVHADFERIMRDGRLLRRTYSDPTMSNPEGGETRWVLYGTLHAEEQFRLDYAGAQYGWTVTLLA